DPRTHRSRQDRPRRDLAQVDRRSTCRLRDQRATPRSGAARAGLTSARSMLTAFLFDERRCQRVEDWRAALGRLGDDRLLWIGLRDPTAQGGAALRGALDPTQENAQRLLEQRTRPSVADAAECVHVTLCAGGIEGTTP